MRIFRSRPYLSKRAPSVYYNSNEPVSPRHKLGQPFSMEIRHGRCKYTGKSNNLQIITMRPQSQIQWRCGAAWGEPVVYISFLSRPTHRTALYIYTAPFLHYGAAERYIIWSSEIGTLTTILVAEIVAMFARHGLFGVAFKMRTRCGWELSYGMMREEGFAILFWNSTMRSGRCWLWYLNATCADWDAMWRRTSVSRRDDGFDYKIH